MCLIRMLLGFIVGSIVGSILIGCGGGRGQKHQPSPPNMVGYARFTINWFNNPIDTSSLRGGRYIPSTAETAVIVIKDENQNVQGSGVLKKPNSSIVIELPVGSYVAEVKIYDINNNLIGGGISERFNITASITQDVRIIITGINEPNNNDRGGATELLFSNRKASISEVFHSPFDNVDWFKINTINNKAYTIHFSVIEENTQDIWKIKISLFNPDNTLIKETTSPVFSVPPPPITINKPTSSIVYIRVEVLSGIFKGFYKLDIYEIDVGAVRITIE